MAPEDNDGLVASEEVVIPLEGDTPPAAEPPPEKENSELVDFGDDDKDDAPIPVEEPKQDAKSRRRIRYDELKERAERAEAAAAQAAQERAHLQGQIDAMKNQAPPAPAVPAVDPEEERRSAIQQELRVIAERRNGLVTEGMRLKQEGTLTPAEQKRLEDADFDLNVQFAAKAAELHRPQAPAAPQLSQADMEAVARRTQITAEFPDVVHNQSASRWAAGTYQRLVAEGWPEDMRTVRQSWTLARERFGGGQPPQPGPAPSYNSPPTYPSYPQPPQVQHPYPAPPQSAYMSHGAQSRTHGPPRGEGPSGGVGGPIMIELSDAQRRYADLVYDNEPSAKVRYQKMAQALKSEVMAQHRNGSGR